MQPLMLSKVDLAPLDLQNMPHLKHSATHQQSVISIAPRQLDCKQRVLANRVKANEVRCMTAKGHGAGKLMVIAHLCANVNSSSCANVNSSSRA